MDVNTTKDPESRYGVSYVATAPSRQIGGSHYDMPIPPVDYIYANGLDFLQGCVVKYISRFRNKGGKEDLLKARHYIDMLIEKEYPDVDFENVE